MDCRVKPGNDHVVASEAEYRAYALSFCMSASDTSKLA